MGTTSKARERGKARGRKKEKGGERRKSEGKREMRGRKAMPPVHIFGYTTLPLPGELTVP